MLDRKALLINLAFYADHTDGIAAAMREASHPMGPAIKANIETIVKRQDPMEINVMVRTPAWKKPGVSNRVRNKGRLAMSYQRRARVHAFHAMLISNARIPEERLRMLRR